MSQIRVGIFGANGYAGGELVNILRKHEDVNIIFATSNSWAGQRVPGTRLSYLPHEDASLSEVEAVFLALPHKASATFAARALEASCRVLDLSADLRMRDSASYEEWYQTAHPHPELLPTPYGLPELGGRVWPMRRRSPCRAVIPPAPSLASIRSSAPLPSMKRTRFMWMRNLAYPVLAARLNPTPISAK